MIEHAPELVAHFEKIVLFLRDNPDVAPKFQGKKPPSFGTPPYLDKLAQRFVRGMEPRNLPEPATAPDPAVAVVMEHGFQVTADLLAAQIQAHRRAMVAENAVGSLLERYIFAKLGDDDWVWCAGETVRFIDFIRPSRRAGLKWESLQVKNRSNSENSASASVRSGTDVQKWHRTSSRTGRTQWESFPFRNGDSSLSEDGFLEFIIDDMRSIRIRAGNSA
ncbi:SinI family restriction endonuclease [Microbacterium sp.]|uniref:SinI family restriction endonuclease n=1 Tax=Microbacterium sp. TaxID=51671 RepID=UPI00289AA4F1|nr:SinI family restriction endonuclease [Microbacterium sp.]